MNFRDVEVLDVSPHFADVAMGLTDDLRLDSSGFGVATPWRDSEAVRRTIKLPFILQGLDEIGSMRRFCDRVSGRRFPFWLPSWVNDFGVIANASAAAASITVGGHFVSDRHALGAQFRFIALLTRSKVECYGVTAATPSGDNDVLTLSRGLDSELVASETVCCPLLLVRLMQDDVEWDYVSSDVIKGEIEAVECPVEYPGADEASSGEDTIHTGSRPVFLYRLTDGVTTMTLADYGVDVVAMLITWQAADIHHASMSSSWDMLGDTLEVVIKTDSQAHPLRAYLSESNLANFSLELWAVDMDRLDLLNLAAPDHIGWIENVDFRPGGEISLQVSSLFRLNERELPTMRMQRTCNWRLFSQGCGASEATFTTAGTVTAISADPAYVDALEFGAKATAESDANWFALGQVTVGTEKRLCTGQAGNRLYLNLPFTAAVAVGATISATAGCDKRVGTCTNKFNQLANHMGAPYMPNENPQLEPLKTPQVTGGKKGG